MTNHSKVNTRWVALSILDTIFKEDQLSHQVLNQVLKQHQGLAKQDRAFITRLVEGTLEHLIQLDYIIDQFSKTKTIKMKPTILNILRLSVYQIKYMDSVPDSAACNEAVKLSKKRGYQKLSSFINGVLRNIARNMDNIQYPQAAESPTKYLSISYSFPQWLIHHWLKTYDFDTVEALCVASQNIPMTSIRCNTTKITPEELQNQLEAQHIKVTPGHYLPYALKISQYDYLEALTPFKQGLFQVQDESSMLIGEVAKVKEKTFVLDVCSAPGGKVTHLGEKMGNKGLILSRDLTEKKVRMIEENKKRLGLTAIKTEIADARNFDESLIEKVDVLLADLPCSGLGIIRKKPDIKYGLSQEKLNDLVKLQKEILSKIQAYVKIGGTLIYSTCTINREENEEVVQWFTDHYSYEVDDLTEDLPQALQSSCEAGMLQLLPHLHGTDGFFIARLKRVKA